MFRVLGRDARGTLHEISVNASSEEEARSLVLTSGSITTIDRVTSPPAAAPPRRLQWSVRTVALLGSLFCLVVASTGAVLGALVGHEADESSRDFFRMRWFFGGVAGAALGLVCGVSLLAAVLKRFWSPR